MLKIVVKRFGNSTVKAARPQYSIPKLSASIILCRKSRLFLAPYDYEVLTLKRKSTTRTFAQALTFPGGRVEKQDQELNFITGAKNYIMTAALRELFEQTGIFLSKKSIVTNQQLEFLENMTKTVARDTIHGTSNPIEYYKQLCNSQLFQQDILLEDFIRLITIPSLPDRYDTYFFLKMLESHKFLNLHSVCQRGIQNLEDTDNLVLDDNEHESFSWLNPVEILRKYFEKQVKLAPPQFIILNIMSKFKQFNQLKQGLAQITTTSKNYPKLLHSPLFFPQIVNMVHNTEAQSTKKYPFAAAFLGDKNFPYDKLITSEKCQNLRKEVEGYKGVFGESKALNRILFSDPKTMFQADYDVKCDAPYSMLGNMVSKNELMDRIKTIN